MKRHKKIKEIVEVVGIIIAAITWTKTLYDAYTDDRMNDK